MVHLSCKNFTIDSDIRKNLMWMGNRNFENVLIEDLSDDFLRMDPKTKIIEVELSRQPEFQHSLNTENILTNSVASFPIQILLQDGGNVTRKIEIIVTYHAIFRPDSGWSATHDMEIINQQVV